LISKAEAEYIAAEMAEWNRPKSDMLYSGKNDDQVWFERHMDRMERYLDEIPDITDNIKLKELEHWFSGEALEIVESGKNNDIFIDHATTLGNIKDSLRALFSGKQKSMQYHLEKLMKGEPIAKGDLEGTEHFTVGLLCQFYRAMGLGETYIFDLKSTYMDIVNTKFPYLGRKWIRKRHELVKGDAELNCNAFIEFVEEEARIEKECLKICSTYGSTFQSEDRDPRDVSTPVRSRSDSGLEEEFSKEDSDSATDDSLSVTGQGRTTHVCGCPLCGDAHLLMRCRKFLSKVPIQRWRFCKREKLCLRCLGKNHISKHCHHTSCLECGGAHHSLLHDHGTHQSSRATCSRPTRRAEERHVRRDDNSDGVSGAEAQRPSREARSRKWHWAPGGAPY
jgi:hypothetical protein